MAAASIDSNQVVARFEAMNRVLSFVQYEIPGLEPYIQPPEDGADDGDSVPPDDSVPQVTTLATGEETGGTTEPPPASGPDNGESDGPDGSTVTTLALGEEAASLPPITTLALGEEAASLPPITTLALGEDPASLPPVTQALGEDPASLPPVTQALGEDPATWQPIDLDMLSFPAGTVVLDGSSVSDKLLTFEELRAIVSQKRLDLPDQPSPPALDGTVDVTT